MSFVVAFFVLAIMVTSCDDSSEPAMAEVTFKMLAKTEQSGINTGGRLAADSLVFNEFLAGVTEFEFETPEEEEQEENGEEDENEELEFEGEFIVDLLNGTSTPDFGIADVIPGVYEEIEIELAPILNNGNTIFVRATFIPEVGDEIIVEYSNNFLIELEFESSVGFEITDLSLNQFLIIINLDALFNGVDFSQGVADADGVVRINSQSNSALAAQIESNFGNAIEAGEDEDDDDEIDD